MSVSNGQIANSATFNGAFLSRTTDSDTIGKIDLLNADSASITDVQSTINQALVDITAAEADIDALEASRVIGPGSSVDNTLPRFDGTTGKTIQASGIEVDDTDSMTIPGDLTVQGNLTIEGTTTSVNSVNLDVEDINITVNKGGSDITAEGSGLTVERTGTDGSFVYEDALVSKWKAGALGSEVEIANVSGAQVFTNKDIDGGTAANTRRITVPKDTLANLLALTRKAGTIVYATDTQKFYYDDGSTLVDSSGGASSSISSTTGTPDAGKIIQTDADGFLDKTFNNTIPSFASDGAFTTFLIRAAVTGDRYFNTTTNKYRVYYSGAFNDLSAAAGPLAVSTKTTTYTATTSDDVLLVDATSASFTVTLPTAVGNTGKKFIFQKINDTNVVTIDGNASELIDGETTYLLGAQYGVLVIISNGTKWITEQRDSVYAEYKTSAGQSMTGGAATIVNYDVKVYDTHDAVVPSGSWTFTSPQTGFYEVEAAYAPSAMASGSQQIFYVYKSGSIYRQISRSRNNRGSSDDQVWTGATTLWLGRGETINIRGLVSTTQNLTADDTANWVTIKLIGGV